MDLKKQLQEFPFIAITRGIMPAEAASFGRILRDAGFRIIETPLNSPEPYKSIEVLAEHFGEDMIVGAGTVVRPEQVDDVQRAGGSIIVSPNCDVRVIERTKECGMISLPGTATVTEMMTALEAGADGLKLFPAEIIGLPGFNAMRAVLPLGTLMIPVGGIDSENWQPYFEAGAAGFGLGSSLYRAGRSEEKVARLAGRFTEAWQNHV